MSPSGVRVGASRSVPLALLYKPSNVTGRSSGKSLYKMTSKLKVTVTTHNPRLQLPCYVDGDTWQANCSLLWFSAQCVWPYSILVYIAVYLIGRGGVHKIIFHITFLRLFQSPG
ncbi:hypothetical protein FKM82_025942 [Ascaphus truei]